VLTIAVVALVAHALVAGMPWAAAIALGAIVAPPDAAAATAVLKQLRPPRRLLVILEGESLFNDASALLVYRLAVGAMLVGTLSVRSAVPMLFFVTVGSVVLGLVLSRAMVFIARIEDVATAVIVQFCSTFAVWMLAERLHLSGILTMVVFAMATARRAGDLIPARIRVPSYAVWEVAVFVLNVLAFILVGFQLRMIVVRLHRAEWLDYGMVAAAVCAATILARIAWVALAARFGDIGVSRRAATVVAWCGMRGTVTLAAALALPIAFPQRDLILFTAFAVVLGTLVLQGITLRPLMTRLRLPDDGEVEREVRLARIATLRAALEAVEECPAAETGELVRRRFELLLRRAEAGEASPEVARELEEDADIIRTATAAERQRLSALRADGTIGDAAFQQIEQELDLEELSLQQLTRG
jgi:CPA1 family monovalent cation:H+ antiporter